MHGGLPQGQTLQLSLGFLGSSVIHLTQNILYSTVNLIFTLLGNRDYSFHTQNFQCYYNIKHCQIPEAQLQNHEVKKHIYFTKCIYDLDRSQLILITDVPWNCKFRLQHNSNHLTSGTWAVTCPLTAGLLKVAGVGSVASHVPLSACMNM